MTTIRYRFNLEQPINQDLYVLKLIRYHYDDHGQVVQQEVLTNNGWGSFHEWDMLPVHDLPSFSGIDAANQRQLQRTLTSFETRIREAIGHDRRSH